MFALISSLVFAVAACVAATAAISTFQASRSRIGDALRGRPLPRVNPELLAVA